MNKDINYYLSRGFDKKVAEYYVSGRKKIVAVTPNPDFSLTIVCRILGVKKGSQRSRSKSAAEKITVKRLGTVINSSENITVPIAIIVICFFL